MKANEAQTIYPMQFKDKIDEYLWKEHQIIGGCCSSIESLKYSIAREVAEKLTDAFIEKACEFLFDEIYDKIEDRYIRNELMEDSYASKIIDDFKNYMKGE